MTGYERTRIWFNFCFEHPEKVKPIHHALYLYTVEMNNRFGWKEKFGLPTDSTMEVLGIKHYKTYTKALNDLIDWGFISLIQKSKNQFTANIIALTKNTKAITKALDKAILLQSQGSVSIDKQLNNETLNKKPLLEVDISDVPNSLKKYYKLAKKLQEVICENLRKKGAPSLKQENATFDSCVPTIQLMIKQDGVKTSQIEKGIRVLGSSDGNFWKSIILTTAKFREKISQLLLSAKNNSKETESMSNMSASVQQKLERYE